MTNFLEHKREVTCGGSSWCTHCGKVWDTGDPDPPSCDPVVAVRMYGRRQGRTARAEIALIGFMAAKLACYEPNSPTVKRAIEYLKCHT